MYKQKCIKAYCNTGGAYLYLIEKLGHKGKEIMDLDNHFPCSIFLLFNQNNSQKIFSCFSWSYIVKFYASFFKDILSLQETILE